MIVTERLKLIPCSVLHYEAALESHDKLAEILGVRLAINWLQFPDSLSHGHAMLKTNPGSLRWGMHLFVHREDKMLIGIGGYKGLPDDDEIVEIGYAVSPEYQGAGLATEAARGLIDNAFSYAFIASVDAHTLAETNDSTALLVKCGMTRIGEKHDPEDGDIWHWRLEREDYKATVTTSD